MAPDASPIPSRDRTHHDRLLLSCPDRRGIVAAASAFLAEHGANILDADQHTDPDDGQFFMRIEFDAAELTVSHDELQQRWQAVADRFDIRWRLARAAERKRAVILVSKHDHCLQDLLYRHRVGELDMDIAAVVSNHPDSAAVVSGYGLRYHTLPVTKENKDQQEARLLEICAEANVHTIILARYMQVLSQTVIDAYPNRIINIHHSFLPAFAGGRPYEQAHRKGVKLIGATSHYVTAELDAGPIIAQQTAATNHRDTVADLVRKGRDLERTTLAAAVRAHLSDKVLVHQGRTVVFD